MSPHEAYIAAVADAFHDAGTPVVDYNADDLDPLAGAIQLTGAPDSDEPGPEVWLGWTEESGWYRGVDRDGRSGLSAIRWAGLGVTPEPADVVAWAHEKPTTQAVYEQMRRTHYRNADDQDDLEQQLAAYAERNTQS